MYFLPFRFVSEKDRKTIISKHKEKGVQKRKFILYLNLKSIF